ncbi:PAS domain S-box-containing protein/diguanylate cyclase (GGDEF) domain-containing protein [Aromatoleum tolulyticum]|uniref:PAS domain S-box-containing protein/diguanylate cyclase (GGDEF) domain-containing protein n=1 Tax=Aromatoleum tolulyticum TaxID=34027 RepID=A0A1N6ZPI3_9RHOO|nr:EAL domain-containing protein [Aromatoleum tolulyticum]SIR28803.1 PAS domain S-box-containing protein/diguanylate cyclase (GGDEF) domain-containing protein [Aromatoleum tolulyticum]
MRASEPSALPVPELRKRVRLGLRGRYTVYGAALTTLVVVVMAALSYFNARALVHGIAAGHLTQIASSVSERIERTLDLAHRELATLAGQPLLSNALLDSQGRDAYLRPFLARHTLPTSIDYNLVVTDYRGDAVAARKAPRSFRGEAWLSDKVLRGETHAAIDRRDADAVLRVAVPILVTATGTFEGALVFEANLSQWLRSAGSPFDLQDDGLVEAALTAGGSTLVQRPFPGNSARLVTSSRAVNAGLPLSEPLLVSVSMDAEVFERPIEALLAEHVGWGLVAILLVGAASYALARAQTRRIEELAGAAREVALTGRPRQGLSAGLFGNDEVGDLAASLVRLLEELKAHESELETLVEERTADLNRAQAIAHVGSWVYLPQEPRLELSAETRRLFGLSADLRLSWQILLEAVHPEDREMVRKAWKRVIAGEPFDIEHRVLLDGEVRWVHEIAERIALPGEPPRCVGTVEDVTERRLTEARMREAMVVFSASSQGIMTMDAQGTITSVNPAFCRITGYAAEEVVGHPSAVFRSGRHDDACHDAMWSTLKTCGEWEGEVWNRRRSGEIYPQWLTMSAVRGEGDGVVEYVAMFSDITERKQHEDEIWRQANFDALTGLANRSLLYDRLDCVLAHARRNGCKAGLLFLDLDGFKWVNDTLGHDVGDELLVEVARRLKGCVREQDTVARLGGDEFTIVIGDLQDTEDLCTVGEKVLGVLEEPIALAGTRHQISGSMGITVFPDDGEDVHSLLRNADIAMYKSKQNDKNRFHFYAREMQCDALKRMQIEADLRMALAHDEFTLEYQPIVAADSGELFGAEALIRWAHPQLGAVSPADFVPVAEDSGLIVPIGAWVLREAVRQMHAWRLLGHALPHLAVNVSGVQFRDPALPELVAEVMDGYAVASGALTLEICESVMVDANSATEKRMRALKEQGVAYSLDDFGTGFSSLSYLKRFPVDIVKIDRSFVRDCPDDRSDAHLVAAIINMAHSLDLKVVAEGVETQAQADFLRERGCDYLQGYLIAKPLRAEAFEGLLCRRVPQAGRAGLALAAAG